MKKKNIKLFWRPPRLGGGGGGVGGGKPLKSRGMNLPCQILHLWIRSEVMGQIKGSGHSQGQGEGRAGPHQG